MIVGERPPQCKGERRVAEGEAGVVVVVLAARSIAGWAEEVVARSARLVMVRRCILLGALMDFVVGCLEESKQVGMWNACGG